MLVLLTIFVTSFIAALSGALMPGPLLAVTVAESPRRGTFTGPLLIVGHGILELSLVIAIMVFIRLAEFLYQPTVFAIIAASGAAILLYMAVGMFRALPKLTLTPSSSTAPSRPLILTGILMSLANPYWSVWWITFGLGCLLQSQEQGFAGVMFFYAGHILADFVWYTSVSTAVAKGRHLLSDRLYRGLIAVCALFLVFFAFYFLYAAFFPKQFLPQRPDTAVSFLPLGAAQLQ
jgi:threonine/homoserine/homoserine lactone efflux protein